MAHRRSEGMLLLCVMIALAIFMALLVKTVLTELASYPEAQPVAPVTSQPAPYGGCDEAWQAPDSAGARWCRDHQGHRR